MANDAKVGHAGIESWDELKAELKAQFLLHNVSWMARETLKRLKHTSTLWDYIREYSYLMLDIQNMSEEDRFFNFLSGLQQWVPCVAGAIEGEVPTAPTPCLTKAH